MFRLVGAKIIIKIIKVYFISRRLVSAVISSFVKQVFQKIIALGIKYISLSNCFPLKKMDTFIYGV